MRRIIELIDLIVVTKPYLNLVLNWMLISGTVLKGFWRLLLSDALHSTWVFKMLFRQRSPLKFIICFHYVAEIFSSIFSDAHCSIFLQVPRMVWFDSPDILSFTSSKFFFKIDGRKSYKPITAFRQDISSNATMNEFVNRSIPQQWNTWWLIV